MQSMVLPTIMNKIRTFSGKMSNEMELLDLKIFGWKDLC